MAPGSQIWKLTNTPYLNDFFSISATSLMKFPLILELVTKSASGEHYRNPHDTAQTENTGGCST